MSEVKTLVTLVLGGMFDHNELGDIDLVYEAPACEALQRDLVDSIDDVHVELVSRIDYDTAQSQLAALREELATANNAYRIVLDTSQQMFERMQTVEQRLADAERRNLLLEELVIDVQKAFNFDPAGSCYNPGIAFVRPWSIRAIAALNPNPEAASHDE